MISLIKGLIISSTLIQVCSAVVIDWDQQEWVPDNQRTKVLENVGNSGYNVQLTFSISSGEFITIDDNERYDGENGLYNGEESLQVYADFKNNIYTNSYVMVEMRFMDEYNNSTPVENVNFSIFDIDHGALTCGGQYTYEDLIWGMSGEANGTSSSFTVQTGSNIGISPDPNTGWGHSSPIYSGLLEDGYHEDTRQDDIADDSSSSTMHVSWDSPVSDVRFYYSTGGNAKYNQDHQNTVNPLPQSIAIGDISFGHGSPVPEASTIFSASLLLLGLSFLIVKRIRGK